MIKAVIFDIGGVLIDNPTKKMFEHYSNVLKVQRDDFLRSFLQNKNAWQNGLIPEDHFWKLICSDLHIAPISYDSLWIEGFIGAYAEKKEMFEITQRLKKRGINQAILSNIEAPIKDYIQAKKYNLFDVSVFSCEVHISKPDKKIYTLTLEKLRVKADEAIFIDDREENVTAANKLGIHGILFQDIQAIYSELSKLKLIDYNINT